MPIAIQYKKDVTDSFTIAENINITDIALNPIGATTMIDIQKYRTISLWIQYDKGAEDNIIITPLFSYSDIGTAYAFNEWEPVIGDKLNETGRFTFDTSTAKYITLNVRSLPFVRFVYQASGTPNGAGIITMAIFTGRT